MGQILFTNGRVLPCHDLLDRFDNGVGVKRRKRAQIQYLRTDASIGHQFGALNRNVKHRPPSD